MSDSTIRHSIRWSSAQDSNVGMVREINEGSILSLPEVQLWAIADGMGGYEAVDRLIQKALDKGANDNVPVILVKGEKVIS